MSTPKSAIKGDIYEVLIEGQYYSFSDGKKGIKAYTLTLRMDENCRKMGFLSSARNFFLDAALKAKYQDYKRFRTHELIEVRNLSRIDEPITELGLMNRKQLVSFIISRKLEIDTELYPTVTDIRQALREFHEDKKAFFKAQEKRRANLGPELAVQRALAELNPLHQSSLGQDAPLYSMGESPELQGVSIPEFDDHSELDALIADL